MPADPFLTGLAAALLDVVRPVELALADAGSFGILLLRLGWTPPSDPAYLQPLQAALDLTNKIQAAANAIDDIIVNQDVTADDVTAMVTSVAAIVNDLTSLTTAPAALPYPPLDMAAFWQDFAGQLASELFAQYLLLNRPGLYAPLHLAGVIDRVFVPGGGRPYRVDHYETTLRWDRLGTLFTNPRSLAQQVYGWGGPLDTATLLDRLTRVLTAYGVPAGVRPSHHPLITHYYAGQPPANLDELHVPLLIDSLPDVGRIEFGLSVLPIPPDPLPSTSPPDGFLIGPYIFGSAATSIPLAGPFSVQLSGGLDSADPVGLEIRPSGVGAVLTAAGTSFDVTAEVIGKPAAPWNLIGGEYGSRLVVADATAGFELKGPVADAELSLVLRTTKITLVLDLSEGDGFLTTLFGDAEQTLDAQGGLRWSSRTGVSFEGEGTLQLTVPINKSIGPVDIGSILIGIEAATGGDVSVVVAITGDAALGPLQVSVDKVGVALTLVPQSGGGANFGSLALGFGFKAPDGLGLALDAGVATGGGYIQCDAAKGQYAGVLELALESLSLTAIGLIQTKMADGTPLPGGFSLLVIISVEFLPPIELGFGFSLNGVGGFLGLNRTMNVDALRAGVRSGSLDDIMFPADPVGHAPQIIQELAGFFPAAPGRFLIGPMVQIQWGSPLPILTADLGVLVELPAPVRVAILGVLQIGLPQADEDAVVLLNLDVLGVVDFGLGTLSLDASLFGSRIAEFPVNGDMALRLGWKAEREFIAAVGGCNPATQPPPDFPTLNRLAISLSSSDKFTFTLQAYFATTSNTIQFGAKAHLLADTGQARLDGMMSFDALIHTHPLGLEVDFAAAVTVWVDGNQLLAVTVAGQLTGPSPWQISGQASVHLFFISATISFHFPLGSAAAPPLPAPVQVIDLLVTDVQQRANWSALPPPGETVVTLTPAPSSGTEMRAHPLGSLTVHQRTVPLGITIDKFGAADVAGPAKLALTSIIYGNSTVDPAAVTSVDDAFAPGQFLRLSDSDALSQPAFATYQAGVAFTPADPSFDDLAVGDVAPVGYSVDFIDSHGQPPTAPLPPLDAQVTARLVPTAPAARAPARTSGPRRYQGTPVGIAVNPRAPAGRQAP